MFPLVYLDYLVEIPIYFYSRQFLSFHPFLPKYTITHTLSRFKKKQQETLSAFATSRVFFFFFFILYIFSHPFENTLHYVNPFFVPVRKSSLFGHSIERVFLFFYFFPRWFHGALVGGHVHVLDVAITSIVDRKCPWLHEPWIDAVTPRCV